MANVQDSIQNAKEKMPNVTPTPPGLHAQATPAELKSRLQWGEPGLTIIDVRDRDSFNECRILGAIPMQMDTLVDVAKSQLEFTRDIYVYGSSDEETAQAAQKLRQGGFQRVAEIRGGLDAWQEIAAPTEGVAARGEADNASEYNIISRLQEFSRVRQEEKKQLS